MPRPPARRRAPPRRWVRAGPASCGWRGGAGGDVPVEGRRRAESPGLVVERPVLDRHHVEHHRAPLCDVALLGRAVGHLGDVGALHAHREVGLRDGLAGRPRHLQLDLGKRLPVAERPHDDGRRRVEVVLPVELPWPGLADLRATTLPLTDLGLDLPVPSEELDPLLLASLDRLAFGLVEEGQERVHGHPGIEHPQAPGRQAPTTHLSRVRTSDGGRDTLGTVSYALFGEETSMTERSAAVKSAWAEGLTYFAVALLITVGIFQVLQGLTALFSGELYVAVKGNMFALDVTIIWALANYRSDKFM